MYGALCICRELRACEERVRHEGLGVCIQHYDAGVQAAREAVLNAGLCAPHRCQSDALAAIDALLNNSSDNGTKVQDTP